MEPPWRLFGQARASDVPGNAISGRMITAWIISRGSRVICPWIDRSPWVAALEPPSVTHESQAWRRDGGLSEGQTGQKRLNLIIA